MLYIAIMNIDNLRCFLCFGCKLSLTPQLICSVNYTFWAFITLFVFCLRNIHQYTKVSNEIIWFGKQSHPAADPALIICGTNLSSSDCGPFVFFLAEIPKVSICQLQHFKILKYHRILLHFPIFKRFYFCAPSPSNQ
mgnify:CR=1 FL=1